MSDTDEIAEHKLRLSEEARRRTYAAGITKEFRQQLTDHVNDLFAKLGERYNPDASNTDSDNYVKTRNAYFRTAAIATFCDHEKWDTIIERWNGIQGSYLASVRGALHRKQEEIATTLRGRRKDVDRLNKKQEDRDNMVTEYDGMRAHGKRASPDFLFKLAELETDTEPLQQYRQELLTLQRSADAINRVIQELDEIRELPALERINYIILGPDEIHEKIEAGEYKGMSFQQFTGDAKLAQLFVPAPEEKEDVVEPEQGEDGEGDDEGNGKGNGGGPGVSTVLLFVPKEQPKELEALLAIKNKVDAYKPDTVFNSSAVRQDFPEDFLFAAGIIGSYLRSAPHLFGLERDGYKFSRTDQRPRSEEEFLRGLLGHLRPSDNSAINVFYLKKAVDRIIDDKVRGHDVFSTDEVVDELRKDGWLIGRKAIGINLGKFAERYSIRQLIEQKDAKNRYYERAQVCPHEDHRRALKVAIQDFGLREVTDEQIHKHMLQRNLGYVSKRVIDHLIVNEGEQWGFKKLSGRGNTYQSTQKTMGADEMRQTATDHPEGEALF